jgi:hypothetical protein
LPYTCSPFPPEAKPNPGPPILRLNWLTIIPNWGSPHDTQLKMVRRYVFSSSVRILSCLQDSSSSTKASHEHTPQ